MEQGTKPVSAWSTAWMPVAIIVLMVGGYVLFQSKFGLIARAEEAVKHELIDGDSAKFRNVRKNSDFEVCGEVNSKNRLGAYIGFTPFLVVDLPSIQDAPRVQFGDDLIAPQTGACRLKNN